MSDLTIGQRVHVRHAPSDHQTGTIVHIEPDGDLVEVLLDGYRFSSLCSQHRPGAGSFSRDSVRPLIVIDPEDRKAIEHLRDLTEAAIDEQGTRDFPTPSEVANALQAALREFADPTPPKPPEPTGWGAVVEDNTGAYWTLIAPESGCWVNFREGRAVYADLAVVRVVSEGVTP